MRKLNSKRIMKRITTFVIVLCIIATNTITVFAAETTDTTKKVKGIGIKTKLESLVTEGTITADQQTAVLNALTPTKVNKEVKTKKAKDNKINEISTKLAELVTAGTITQEQKTAIESIATQKGKFKTLLKGLVTDGTITSEQKVAVLKAITPVKIKNTDNANKSADKEKADSTKKTKKAKAADTTKSEKAANRLEKISNKLSELVSSGTITETQKEKILTALQSKK